MATMKEAATDFLGQKRIAVIGVSRSSSEAANLVYRTLRDKGYEAFAVNPNASEVEGVSCYANVKEIPGGVDAAVVATTPDVTDEVVRDCQAAGISRMWLHRSFGAGSVSEEAADYGKSHGMMVIAGGCPLMFVEGADFGHRCMRFVLGLTGGLPKET
jgi:predicted CoA-binding protein